LKVVFFDTESNSLEASWGRILCCSFVDLDGKPKTYRGDKRPYKGTDIVDDSKLVSAIKSELEQADIIVSWNGILHDIPLLNSRLGLAGIEPIRIGEKFGNFHLDLMYYVRGASHKIGGSKLDTAAKFFRVENEKTPLDGRLWQLAAAGDSKAMNEIVGHCEADVLVLRDLWPKLAPSVKKVQFNLSEVYPFITDIPSRRG
jgi:uncharacterized protein YprB with RNaseH-like and TPR domain